MLLPTSIMKTRFLDFLSGTSLHINIFWVDFVAAYVIVSNQNVFRDGHLDYALVPAYVVAVL